MVPNLHCPAIDRGQVRRTSTKKVTAQHTLERVRNNQRRHRAQRREYIKTLELKLDHAEQRIKTLGEQVDALQAELAQYQKQDAPASLLGRAERTDGIPPAPEPGLTGVDSQVLGPLANAFGRSTVTHSSPNLLQLLPPDNLRGPELANAASPHATSLHTVSDNIDGTKSPTAREVLRPLVPEIYSYDHLIGTAITAVSGSSNGGAECSSCSCNMLDVAAHRASYQLVGDPRPWLSAAVDVYSDPLAPEPCCSSRRTSYSDNLTTGDHSYDFDLGSLPVVPGCAPQSPIHVSRHTTEDESTMLCAEAYLLIEQQNFKGVHQKDVATWLWTGFRKSPKPGEGCRVKTDLLFSLLTFISES